MLKHKHSSKDVKKRSDSVPVNSKKSAANGHHQADFVINNTQRTVEDRRCQQVRALGERTYPHKSVPPGHGNNPELLKYYLAQNFASPANLAREANVSRAAVSAVIHGRTRSERIERMIAKSCGRTLQELFPAWYPGAE